MATVTLEGSTAANDAGGDGAARSACEQDLFPEGDAVSLCGDLATSCTNTKPCGAIVRCMFDKGCFSLFINEEVNRCSLPCVLGAGVTSTEDPALIVAVKLSNCSAAMYPDVCYPTPDGGPR